MTTAVLLLTMRCNIACAHCSVDSHPQRQERMEVEEGLAYIRGLARAAGVTHVDLSGGEPLLHLQDVKRLACEARRHGLGMRLTSNGFWAGSPAKAERILRELSEAGVTGVGLSIDMWHLPFVPPTVVVHYIAACRAVGFQPLISAVVQGTPSAARRGEPPPALIDLLREYGLDRENLITVENWRARHAALPLHEREKFERHSQEHWILVAWQVLTAEGRGQNLSPCEEDYGSRPPEACPAAGDLPTIDPEGRLFPCCSPWISRKGHAYGRTSQASLPEDLARLRGSALVRLLHEHGPERLIEALRACGLSFPTRHSGICNQCGHLLDRLPLPQLEQAAAWLLAQDAAEPNYAILGITPIEGLKQWIASEGI